MTELTLDAKTENLHRVFDFLVPRLEKLGCGKKTIRQCKLCAEEIFLNIANYAYNPEIGSVRIVLETVADDEPAKLAFTFSDTGTPYDPLSIEDPDVDASLEQRQIGGLGVFLVKTTMDDVSYEYKDGHNILRFVKILDKK